MNILALVSDAYGGRGGIALYNKNFLQAICLHPMVDKVVVIPRAIIYKPEELPEKLIFNTDAAGSKLKYLLTCMMVALSKEKFDLIVCSHLHLLPFAYFIRWFKKCPLIPIVYGIEAWRPTSHWSVNWLCRKLDFFIAIREYTARCFIDWTNLKRIEYFYLPNCIEGSKYGLAKKSQGLLDRYGIAEKVVIMTTGRLDEKRKGFDEILEILPELRKHISNLVYLIVGDGSDRERLAEKAKTLGVNDMVIFTGYVPEREKADHFRLADVFAMPGSDKDFDSYPYRFVFLEALACGVPVVGCRVDDESEANDPLTRKMIIQVNPNNKEEIIKGILEALPFSGLIHTELKNFYFQSFVRKVHQVIDRFI